MHDYINFFVGGPHKPIKLKEIKQKPLISDSWFLILPQQLPYQKWLYSLSWIFPNSTNNAVASFPKFLVILGRLFAPILLALSFHFRRIWQPYVYAALVKSDSLGVPYKRNEYPVDVVLNNYIYLRYSVETVQNLVVMAVNCKATKTGNFYSSPYYNLITDG